ncbi:fatty acyl-AMP ligase [Pelomonas sp. BJYL3]|uniref:fatty acyl-AMP ligase n=1 Tax=Pelomonas sp. BJYL3 TaxID=2976697 RepID=UPI0022B4CFA5|nr:fatty acyl-AMP ligase [Pelomonas sp. BJYL3]
MNTWIDALLDKARNFPDKLAFANLDEAGEVDQQLTFAALLERAELLARHLQQHTRPQDRVLLLYAPGLDYVEAFYACMLAGVVAVPLYSPQNERKLELIDAIAADCQAALALSTQLYCERMAERAATRPAGVKQLPWLATDCLREPPAAPWSPPAVGPDDLAYLQYTSGSTSTPKGVMLSHRLTLAHSRELQQLWDTTPDSVLVSWLPHFHDLGQVFSILHPVYLGMRSVLMAPAVFMQRPQRWLQAISDFKASHSAAPDFAYMHCARHVTEADLASLDLSSWRVAVNGAEPVRADSILAFDDRFAVRGATLEMHRPSYGLAEATLVVTAHKSPWGPRIMWFNSEAFSRNEILPCLDTDPKALALVSNGRCADGVEVAIVDPVTRARQGENTLGEIWVSGPAVGLGYWARPQDSSEVFQAAIDGEAQRRYLRTGDLGFLHEGELFIAGRSKDVIIVRGSNHYPQDIELTVERAHPLVREGYTACFSVQENGFDQLIIAAERKRYFADDIDYDEVMRAIQAAVVSRHGIPATEILLLKPGVIAKTTSGKIQRSRCRAEYLEGSLRTVARQRLAPAEPPTAPTAPAPAPAAGALAAPTMQHVIQCSIVNFIKDWVARELKRTPDAAAGESPLSSLGLSSMDMFRLHGDLETFVQKPVPSEWTWEAPSLDALASQLAQHSLCGAPAA